MPAAAVHDWRERPWFQHFRRNRPRRILLLLAAVWIMQGFDLGFTVVAHRCESFAELNPVARWALQRGATGAIVYKVTLVLLGSVILWCCRRRVLSECLLWLVVAACVGLSLRWRDYFHYFVEDAQGAAVVQPGDASIPPRIPWVESLRAPDKPVAAAESDEPGRNRVVRSRTPKAMPAP
jgi:hypothetical protein